MADHIEEYREIFQQQVKDILPNANVVFINGSHITLCMATILTRHDYETVCEIIDKHVNTIEDLEFAEITLEGLNIMEEDPKETRVLYVEPTFSNRSINNLAVEIQKDLIEADIPTNNEQGFSKPHLTLINQRDKPAIDATNIL